MEDKGDHGGSFLGDLPREIREERREISQPEDVRPMGPPGIIQEIPGARAPVPTPPPLLPNADDVRRSTDAYLDASQARIGLPAVDFLVQTTYDARPINGNDFRFEEVRALDPNADPPVLTASVTFQVPPGRIAVLRRVSWYTNQLANMSAIATTSNTDNPAIRFTSPVYITLSVAGSIQRTYERIYRQQSDEDVYAIAGENEQIILSVTINDDFSGLEPNQYAPNYVFYMYGNLIDSRGREKQYEPANMYQRGLLK